MTVLTLGFIIYVSFIITSKQLWKPTLISIIITLGRLSHISTTPYHCLFFFLQNWWKPNPTPPHTHTVSALSATCTVSGSRSWAPKDDQDTPLLCLCWEISPCTGTKCSENQDEPLRKSVSQGSMTNSQTLSKYTLHRSRYSTDCVKSKFLLEKGLVWLLQFLLFFFKVCWV